MSPPLPLLTTPVIRQVVQITGAEGVFELTFDYLASAPTPPSFADLATFQTAFRTGPGAALLGCLATDMMVTAYFTADYNPSLVPTFVTPNLSLAGTVTGSSLPSTLAATTVKRTAVKGRHGRGRNAYGPIPATFVTLGATSGVINASAITAYSALNAALLVPLTVGALTYALAVITRPLFPATVPTRGVAVINVTIDSRIGLVRRRKQGVGQ